MKKVNPGRFKKFTRPREKRTSKIRWRRKFTEPGGLQRKGYWALRLRRSKQDRKKTKADTFCVKKKKKKKNKKANLVGQGKGGGGGGGAQTEERLVTKNEGHHGLTKRLFLGLKRKKGDHQKDPGEENNGGPGVYRWRERGAKHPGRKNFEKGRFKRPR